MGIRREIEHSTQKSAIETIRSGRRCRRISRGTETERERETSTDRSWRLESLKVRERDYSMDCLTKLLVEAIYKVRVKRYSQTVPRTREWDRSCVEGSQSDNWRRCFLFHRVVVSSNDDSVICAICIIRLMINFIAASKHRCALTCKRYCTFISQAPHRPSQLLFMTVWCLASRKDFAVRTGRFACESIIQYEFRRQNANESFNVLSCSFACLQGFAYADRNWSINLKSAGLFPWSSDRGTFANPQIKKRTWIIFENLIATRFNLSLFLYLNIHRY